MSVVLQNVLVALLRYALFHVSAKAVEHGIATPAETEQLIVGLAGLLLAIGSLFWVKYRDRFKFVVALTQPPGTTEADVKGIVHERGARIGTYVSGLVTTPPPACGALGPEGEMCSLPTGHLGAHHTTVPQPGGALWDVYW